jgi:hypothetical protein
MTTDYLKWASFDVGAESERVEKKWKIEEVEDKYNTEEMKVIKHMRDIQTKLGRILEALLSKVVIIRV